MGSLFKWLNDRTGLVTAAKTWANWTVPAGRCLCRYLPAAIIFAFLLQGITGLFLWAFYSPSAVTAWESVYHVQYNVPYGWLVRGIHHFSAQLLVGTLFVYILLMIVHGSYRKPREFVYWSALVMFLLTLCSCLTGDLLSWSLSGYFATIARVSFLQLIPKIGVMLYQLVVGGPDPQFGTLTLTRFTVLHIAVFGGGFLGVMIFWKWADIRSRKQAQTANHSCALACASVKQRPFWGCEAIGTSLACVIFFIGVMLLVFQHSLTSEQIAARSKTLPAEAYLGAELAAPADPGGSYDAARPEWSFRALYYYSKFPIFSKIGMFCAIFVFPTILALYFFGIPIFERIVFVHYLIVGFTVLLFILFCRFTYLSYWDDYKNPEHAPTFLAGKAEADVLRDRAVELAHAPAGIPKTGALDLLKKDTYVQGPKLFKQHCASCHNFTPMKDQTVSADFAPIVTAEPSAPNLYQSVSAQWMRGFHNEALLKSDDYFGKTTKFAKTGSMIGFVTGRLQSGAYDKSGGFILNQNGLLYPLIGADGGFAFDILESALTQCVKENKDLVKKGDYIAKLKELVAARFNDQKFLEEKKIKAPKAVLTELAKVLAAILDDPEYVELLKDEDNIGTIVDDDDIASFLEETFLAHLCGGGEPIAKEKQKYINQLRDALVVSCNEMTDILYEESQLEEIRPLVDGKYQNLRANAIDDMNFLTCTECHTFYGSDKALACDLRGYMSKKWIAGIISDPANKTYYGKKNDRMPAYFPVEGDKLLNQTEVQMIADWMHGKWYRAPEFNKTADAPKADAPKVDAPKAEAPKAEAPKVDAPKVDAPKAEAPKVDAPKADAPKADAPKAEAPKADAPKADAPKADAPKVDAPKVEAPKADAPKAEAPKADAPKVEAPKADAPKEEAPKVDAPKVEAPKAEAPKAEAPKAEAPKAASAK